MCISQPTNSQQNTRAKKKIDPTGGKKSRRKDLLLRSPLVRVLDRLGGVLDPHGVKDLHDVLDRLGGVRWRWLGVVVVLAANIYKSIYIGVVSRGI
jgi:hypothetical protein